MKFFRSTAIPLAFLFSLLFLLLAPLLLACGFTSPADPPKPSTFREDRERIEICLREAQEAYPSLSEEDPAGARQAILFYECALRYSLPIWSGDFYLEGASLWAVIQREWEILNANPTQENTPRRQYLEEMDRRLTAILEKKDFAALPSFYEEFYLAEKGSDPKEVHDAAREMEYRIFATADGTLSPTESYVIYRISEIDQSLKSGVNRADPAREGTPLSQKDKIRMEGLREYYLGFLKSGGGDRVVANEETLNLGEEIFTFLILPATLLCLWERKRKGAEGSFLPHSLLFSTLFCFAASVGILFSATLWVPQSLTPYPVFFFSHLFSVPFALALSLRMLLRLVSLIPIFFVLENFSRKGKSRKKWSVGLLFGLIFYQGLSIAFRVYLAQSPINYFLPFGYWDLKGALMPSFPLSLFTPHPAAALGGIALIYGTLLFPLFPKGKAFREKSK